MYILTLPLPLPLPQSLSHNTLSHSVAPAYDVGGLGGRTQVRTEAKTHAQTEDTRTHTHMQSERQFKPTKPNNNSLASPSARGQRQVQTEKCYSLWPQQLLLLLLPALLPTPKSAAAARSLFAFDLCAHTMLTATVSTLLKLHCTVNTVAAGCAVHCGGGGAQVL